MDHYGGGGPPPRAQQRGGYGGRDGGGRGGYGGRRSASPEPRGGGGGGGGRDDGWNNFAPPPSQQHYQGGPPEPYRGESSSYRGSFSGGRGGGGGGGGGMRGGGYGHEEHLPPRPRDSYEQVYDQGYGADRRPPPPQEFGFPPARMEERASDFDSRPMRGGPPRSGGGGARRDDERMVRHKSTREEDENEGKFIADRINKERPCRTLFVRNLKFETSGDEVKARFDRMGEVKSFFDLIPNRGMIFVTYYDIRAAIMAKEKLQGSDLLGRAMDVHYSLPRDVDRAKRCDREKNQGSLTLSVPDASGPILESELMTRFSAFGDVKAIFQSKARANERYVEYYDIRGCQRAHDELNGSPISGGTMDLRFAWDVLPPPPPRPAAPVYSGPPAGSSNSYQATDRGDPYARGGYQSAPPPLAATAAPPIPSLNERLEQAQKVQQLLAALAVPAAAPPPPALPAAVAPYAVYPAYGQQPPAASGYGQPSPYPTYAPPPAAVPSAGVPPAILALLAAQSGQPVRATPPPLSAAAPGGAAAPAQVQALLALLAQQQQQQRT